MMFLVLFFTELTFILHQFDNANVLEDEHCKSE